MTTTEQDIAGAIEHSVRRDCVATVTIPTDTELWYAASVLAASDDYAELTDGSVDAWGEEDGVEWRINIRYGE